MFRDRVMLAAGIVFLLIVGLVVFNLVSPLPEDYPLFGVLNFSLVPILFVAGGIIFVLAIIKETKGSD